MWQGPSTSSAPLPGPWACSPGDCCETSEAGRSADRPGRCATSAGPAGGRVGRPAAASPTAAPGGELRCVAATGAGDADGNPASRATCPGRAAGSCRSGRPPRVRGGQVPAHPDADVDRSAAVECPLRLGVVLGEGRAHGTAGVRLRQSVPREQGGHGGGGAMNGAHSAPPSTTSAAAKVRTHGTCSAGMGVGSPLSRARSHSLPAAWAWSRAAVIQTSRSASLPVTGWAPCRGTRRAR